MSNSILYHTFGIRSVQHFSTDFFHGRTIFRGSAHDNNLKCSDCKSRDVIRSGQIIRTFKAVAADMASGYIAAVLEHLPKADLVLDHFHLVKWFNDKLSLLRRQLYQQATSMEKAVLKGSRWLLLKAPENLKAHQDRKKDES